MTEMRQTHFCIDIDNVIARTDEVMRRVIADLTGGRVSLEYDDVVTFNYYECRDSQGRRIDRDEWKKVHEKFSEEQNILSIEPMNGAVEAINRLVEVGTVHLATSRMHKARKATIDWLVKHKFSERCDLHFLKHGEKHAALKQFTAAVEDDYDQAVGYAMIGGTPCYLMLHPWNGSRPELPNVTRMEKDWPKLTNALIAVA